MPDPVTVIPARGGRAVRIPRGSEIEIINPSGTQVVDTWALCPPEWAEHMSMEHTRVALGRLVPRVGDALYSNARRALMTLVADTSPGVHDTLMASCDAERYRQLGTESYHASCADNFAAALRELGESPPPVPAPLNLFMNVPWTADGSLSFAAPRSRAGDLVRLRAETDLIVVLSACPQDLLPVNGEAQRPAEVHYRLLGPSPESGPLKEAAGTTGVPWPSDEPGEAVEHE
ncbi:MAG TPA: urea carboxylase-associated family protein [Streptosporangiaceae bacterium]|nr:urea carboxylase-associated family protein [Streptosporangiaceae bacterium]